MTPRLTLSFLRRQESISLATEELDKVKLDHTLLQSETLQSIVSNYELIFSTFVSLIIVVLSMKS